MLRGVLGKTFVMNKREIEKHFRQNNLNPYGWPNFGSQQADYNNPVYIASFAVMS